MKIWIITSEYPGEGAIGGISRYVENIAYAFARKGVDLTVITLAESNYHCQVAEGFSIVGFTSNVDKITPENLKDAPARSAAFPYNIMAYWPALSYQVSDVVESLIQRIGAPDVIECQEYQALPYYLLQKKLIGYPALQNIPILVHCHTPSFVATEINHQPSMIFPGYWVGEMEKFCIATADAVLCPSNHLAKKIAKLAPCRTEIQTIPYLIPSLASLTSSSVSLPISDNPTVLYFGRLEVRKGILKALEPIEFLWNAGHNFRVVLVGEDMEYGDRGVTMGAVIRSRYAHRINTGLLEIHGEQPMGEVAKYIATAEVVIVPSLWENFPNTCIEAMSLSRVVLAAKNGGQAEMIGEDGQAGVLFDWEVPEDFATQLERLLKMGSEERGRMGERAHQRITEYCSVEKIVSQRLRHFEEIIERHQKQTLFPAAWLGYTPPATIHNENFLQTCNEPLRLSAVIPFYNHGKYLGDAVQSVLANTCVPEEILIVNDGSTEEDSLANLRELEDLHPSVRVIHQPNQGLASARNRGAKEARGQYIAFLDADDEIQPEYFEKTLRILEAYANVGFVYSWVQYFGASKDIWPTWNIHFPYLLGHNMLNANCVVRREAFLEVGGNNRKFEYGLEDYECWINLAKHGWLGVSLPECLVRYRIRAGSMFRSITAKSLRYTQDLIVLTHPELYQQWGGELARLQATNGSSIGWNSPAGKNFFPAEDYLPIVEKQRDDLQDYLPIVEKQRDDLQDYLLLVERQRDELWEQQQTLEFKISSGIAYRLGNIGPVRFLMRQSLVRKTLEKILGGTK